MAKTFHLTIARVGENLFDGEAIAVTVPGVEGTMTVLANHEPFVTLLAEGTVRVQDQDGQPHEFALPGNGILEVSGNQATIII